MTHVAGAYGYSESYSSVPVDIQNFYMRSRNDLEHIVSFPYLKLEQMGTKYGNNLEDICLATFKERVLGFSMRGTPVGCVSVELILSGNGLQLSKRFCTSLREFCTRVGITIVVDEILTGFRCACVPTVLFADQVGLQPDFIVLGKFIGCGLVLQDKTITSTTWVNKGRRYPTTNCSVDQLLSMTAVLRKTSEILTSNPQLFKMVEEAVREVHPSSVGRGLIWFFNRADARAIPAPKGVKRLLVKLFDGGSKNMESFRSLLGSYDTYGKSLTRHIKDFQYLIDEFAKSWHNRSSQRFLYFCHTVFGVAHALRVRLLSELPITSLKEFYLYVTRVSQVSKVSVRRIIDQVEENAGEKLFHLSTTNTEEGRLKVYLPCSMVQETFFRRQKRKRTDPPPAAATSASMLSL